MFARPRLAAITLVALLASLLPAATGTAIAAEPVTVQFWYVGAEQVFVVPEGVTSLHVIMVGGKGGTGASPLGGPAGAGGHGALVAGDLEVTPGSTLFIEVAGNGGNGDTSLGNLEGSGGFGGGGAGGAGEVVGGGGGGGGATDLRTSSRSDLGGTLASRIAVAAGGGGGAGGQYFLAGGPAGSGGSSDSPTPGGPGTATSGGIGGVGGGVSGALGVGGAGAPSVGGGGGSGGGGGGHFGGGGGGSFPGGGGGGSNLTASLTNATVTIDTTGVPKVEITYGTGPEQGTGTVEAEVTVPASAACLELSEDVIRFGTLPLGATHEPATPAVTVTNCSGTDELVFASATDADGPGAHWALTDAPEFCEDTLGLDAYRLRLEGLSDAVQLRTLSKPIGSLAPLGSDTHTPYIDMACPGSSGAGVTMSMQIVFTATD